jgi:predicted nucleic acid-binding protein
VIAVDTSVCVKWFKAGERYESEAQALRQLIEAQQAEAVANEITSLEIVRGLKNAQLRQPSIGISDAEIDDVFTLIEEMFRTGILLECPVTEVKVRAKDLEISLGLFMADALHLATAVHLQAEFFVTDDHHFLTPEVVGFAGRSGVKVLGLPDLMAAIT